MTDQGADHTVFDELAAGYALYALEPADEQVFRQHAGQCLRCRRLLAGFGLVTEALAQATPAAEPSGQLGDQIIAAALADEGHRRRLPSTRPTARHAAAGGMATSRPAGPPGSPMVAPRWRRTWPRRHLAAAAAAVALIAGGLWAGLSATGGGGPQRGLAACAHLRGCSQVTLAATGTGRPAATVIVHDGVVSMDAAGMAANPAGEIYVLWQITGGHTPLPVGSFDIRPGEQTPLRIGGLAAPYSATWAFAVSLEHGRMIPASPSRPIALGQVS